ncbi:velvet factor [Gorgonomyces haynaldii]|nr:velvet factor [Gorgonomyces haynaldii]
METGKKHRMFELIVRQQPLSGRMSGYANPKDIRIIAPPLILQARAFKQGKTVNLIDNTESLYCKVVLSQNGDSISPNRAQQVPMGHDGNLLGTTMSPCHVLRDLDDTEGMFFLFPDLGIRASGNYQLYCYLIDVELSLEAFPVAAQIATDCFTVYAPKEFPGTPGPTALSSWFHRQGVLFHNVK